jgi:hypothetical protein
MTLQVVGAGLGRTGTASLQTALQQLLGGRCYHMVEVFGKDDVQAAWRSAAEGGPVDWAWVFDGYVATVDWPAASFWPELTAEYPDAVVLLSTRKDAAAWWKSASNTILQPPEPGRDDPFFHMWKAITENRFTPEWTEAGPAMEAYERHNAAVRAGVPAERLLEWQPGDGWEPLCERLGVPVPDEPFPHMNTTEQFRAMVGMDPLPPELR